VEHLTENSFFPLSAAVCRGSQCQTSLRARPAIHFTSRVQYMLSRDGKRLCFYFAGGDLRVVLCSCRLLEGHRLQQEGVHYRGSGHPKGDGHCRHLVSGRAGEFSCPVPDRFRIRRINVPQSYARYPISGLFPGMPRAKQAPQALHAGTFGQACCFFYARKPRNRRIIEHDCTEVAVEAGGCA
jgi:hypothetical protein